jgi:predicted DNA-binding transcriptional regulator AlpA
MNLGERGIRIAEAAARIGMSKSFLRDSNCPRHRKIGNGPKGQPIVIFYASEVDTWWESREFTLERRPLGKTG